MHIPFPLRTDSYKLTHWKQYPPNTTEVYSYLESRGGLEPATMFFGLQYYLSKYLEGCVVTQKAVRESAEFAQKHLGADHFNIEGWMHIVDAHHGRLPVEIKAVPEGTLVPTGNVLVSIVNTDPKCYWLPNFLETLLLKVWYPITVATKSYYLRQYLAAWLESTGCDPNAADFMLHDFGYRGVSSEESAAIGGAAHLTSFKGSDTLIANALVSSFYDQEGPAGFSVPATEHSTITSRTRAGELDAYRNALDQYPGMTVSIVSDSYDIFEACRMYGSELRDKIVGRGAPLVIRPDSGDPVTVIGRIFDLLYGRFPIVTNESGFRSLPNIKILWGDGINVDTIGDILEWAELNRWAADNFVFGMGGALLQKCDRDTQKFAFKCSSATVDGEQRDVFKDPITDPGKQSKKGKLGLYCNTLAGMRTAPAGQPGDLLRTVFMNGEVIGAESFATIRERLTKHREGEPWWRNNAVGSTNIV